jgi:UDP-N-acetylglucosamine--N-acetylmuramyl-(pentapeptide) pyrophosphoryl-undecaprenol N-acetylglucosamine transferase
MSSTSTYKIIISGGGTGGHIYPAIAIANALKELFPTCEILFVGAIGRMEMEKIPAAGYTIEGLWISGIQRKISLDNLIFPVKVLSSLVKARKILKQFKPDIAIGVGGYASFPLLYMAGKLNIPTLIQEQNGYAGIANKFLAGNAQKICVAYEGMDKFFPQNKIIMTGNPVRKDIQYTDTKREEGLKHFKLDPDRKIILVIGGSLGARTINESIDESLEIFKNENVQVLWQTGKWYIGKARKKESQYANIRVFDFIYQMDLAYAVADVVISRAGALSISELSIVGKPVILVPSPNVAEDHQTKNAMALVDSDAAILVKDVQAKSDLVPTAISLLHNEAQQTLLCQNIEKLGRPKAADTIAEVIAVIISK